MIDVVDRLTPLGLMVLALLGEGDMHPYEMMRLMRQRRDDRLVPIANGTLYHTVARLERTGLVAEVGVDREGNRPDRTTYTLTPRGGDAVREWVRRELARIDHPAEFRVALAEAHNLDRDEVIALLRIRRAVLAASLATVREGRAAAFERGVPEQFLLEVERAVLLQGADLAWLDGILERLEHQSFSWGAPIAPSPHYLESRKAARL